MTDSSVDRLYELEEVKADIERLRGTLCGMHPADTENILLALAGVMDAVEDAIFVLRDEAALEERAEMTALEREYWASR